MTGAGAALVLGGIALSVLAVLLNGVWLPGLQLDPDLMLWRVLLAIIGTGWFLAGVVLIGAGRIVAMLGRRPHAVP